MKKTISILSAALVVLVFSMCNGNSNDNATNPGEDATATSNTNAKSDMSHPAPGDSAKFISKQVVVKGDVENQLTLTVDSLKMMNVQTLDTFDVVCQSGATVKVNKTSKGVLLKDILEKAKIVQQNHKDRNFYIVARATDNYKATFSWAEIFNNPTGENVYMLFEENDAPIKAQGDMILVCKNDIKTGPRHVFWLSSIEVNRVD